MGIYKRKQESKKKRKNELDQEKLRFKKKERKHALDQEKSKIQQKRKQMRFRPIRKERFKKKACYKIFLFFSFINSHLRFSKIELGSAFSFPLNVNPLDFNSYWSLHLQQEGNGSNISWTRNFAQQFAFCSAIALFYSAISNFKTIFDHEKR